MAIGQNPILLDGKLEITPNEWMIPLRDGLKSMKSEMSQGRTNVNRLDKQALLDTEAKLQSYWCG